MERERERFYIEIKSTLRPFFPSPILKNNKQNHVFISSLEIRIIKE